MQGLRVLRQGTFKISDMMWLRANFDFALSAGASSRVRAGGLFAANFAFSRKTRRNASSYGLSKEIIVVVFLFLSIHLYLLHFCSEDSYQTDIKIDDESVKAEVIDTAGNVSRASCYSMTVFPTSF